MPWYYEKRNESLSFFAKRGNRQVIAGYYGSDSRKILDWLEASQKVDGVLGAMYTTWENSYNDLETFSKLIGAKRGNAE